MLGFEIERIWIHNTWYVIFCYFHCFGSGSGRIRIIGPDPDPLQETLIWIRVPTSKLQQKMIIMSFKPYTEKIKKKNWNLFGSRSRTGPGSWSIIPEADPRIRIRIKMKRIRNTGYFEKELPRNAAVPRPAHIPSDLLLKSSILSEIIQKLLTGLEIQDRLLRVFFACFSLYFSPKSFV